MTASVEFDEDYANPDSEVQAQDRAAGWRPRRIRRIRRARTRSFEPCARRASTGTPSSTARRRPTCSPGCSSGRPGAATRSCSATSSGHGSAPSTTASITVDQAGFAFANGGMSRLAARPRPLRPAHARRRGVRRSPGVLRRLGARIRAGADPELMAGTDFARAYPPGSYRAQWWNTGGEGEHVLRRRHLRSVPLDRPGGGRRDREAVEPSQRARPRHHARSSPRLRRPSWLRSGSDRPLRDVAPARIDLPAANRLMEAGRVEDDPEAQRRERELSNHGLEDGDELLVARGRCDHVEPGVASRPIATTGAPSPSRVVRVPSRRCRGRQTDPPV